MYWISFLKKESNLVTSSKNDIFMQAGFFLTFLVIFGISSGFEQTGDMVKVGLIWFLMMFLGPGSEINLNQKYPEFNQWKWVDIDDLPRLIVPFKKKLFKG